MNSENDSESIYRAPESETTFTPQGDLLSAYVGPKNADYYARKFDQFKSGGSSVSWHWPAFFISSWWLLYRKMWLNALLYWVALPIALTIVSAVVATTVGAEASGIFYYASYIFITFVLVPIFANKLYYRHAQKKADKVASVMSSGEQQSAELSRIGGTSRIVLILIPFVLIAVVGIVAAISIPAYQDYTIRAQVSEGLTLSSGAKGAVSVFYRNNGAFPSNNEMALIKRIDGKYTESVIVDEGSIIVTYGNDAHQLLHDSTIILEPSIASGDELEWTCSSQSIMPRHLPAACR